MEREMKNRRYREIKEITEIMDTLHKIVRVCACLCVKY